MKTKRGEVGKWLHEVAIPYEGDECLRFPFFCGASGHARLNKRTYGAAFAHEFVALAVHGEPPSDQHEVCHTCGGGKNGCVAPRHLRWGTRAENMQDRKLHGELKPPQTGRGERSPRAKLTADQVREIRAGLAGGATMEGLAATFGVGLGAISGIKYGLTWTHI